MPSRNLVALVSLLALLTYFWMGLQVSRARGKSGIAAPATTGDPTLERWFRAHYNTLEWLPIFLVSLWLFALYWNQLVASALGLVWIVARIMYATAYVKDPSKRELGFTIQSLATAILLFGALGKIVWAIATVGI